MTSNILVRFGRILATSLLVFGMPLTPAMAQQPAGAAPAASAAAAPAADVAAKPAPVLPAGSTANPGWNVPPKWSDVQQKAQYASVPGRETNVLIEDAGRDWRLLRNGPITFYGGIILLVVPAMLLLFYVIRGQIKLQSQLTGRLIERFNSAERVTHWTMAISFVVLAITGLSLLFGKYVILPLLGAGVFASIASVAKLAHNFVGPLFMFSLIVFIVMFIRDNIWRAYDMAWLSKLGGMLSGAHVPSGRFNAGEKVWFWVGVILFGLVICISGVILLFPNWNTGRDMMGDANLVHAGVGCVLIAMSLGHIYLGTVGMAGAYQAMREGTVDEAWAKEHHEIWYDEVKSGKRDTGIAGAPHPAAGDD